MAEQAATEPTPAGEPAGALSAEDVQALEEMVINSEIDLA